MVYNSPLKLGLGSFYNKAQMFLISSYSSFSGQGLNVPALFKSITMNIRLLDGSEPVILDIEDNSYKPKMTITSKGVSISADLTSCDIDDITFALLGTGIQGYEEEITKLQEENDNLEAKVNELEEEVEDLEEINDELNNTIAELEKRIKELESEEKV